MQALDEPQARAPSRPGRDARVKSQHIEVCLTQPVDYLKSTGLEQYELTNQALPELALGEIDLSTVLAGKSLRAPLMIGPMTGGTVTGYALNRVLAAAAQRFGLAMGVGSQRVALEQPHLARFFQVRDIAPDIALFANFGAAQLARGWGVAEARRAVAMIGADALFIHFNPLQEAIQGGDRDFRGVAQRLTLLCRELGSEGIPVFAREVCFGLSVEAAQRLLDCGVSGLDCAGAGGTSWAKVEALCAVDPRRRELGLRLGEWGIPTAQSIRNVRTVSVEHPLIASGGLRSGLDLAISLALGAQLGAMARPLLVKAHQGEEQLNQYIEDVLAELRVCMFAAGAQNGGALRGKARRVGASA